MTIDADGIYWAGVIEYAQWAASEGRLVTALFTKDRQQEAPGDYTGEPTVWPSQRDAFRHFARHPEAWELVRAGYEWRSFKLWDRIEGYRKQVENGDLEPRAARILVDSCLAELKTVGARGLQEQRAGAKDAKPAGEGVAERLARASQRADEAQKTAEVRRELNDAQEVADAERRAANRGTLQ